MNSVLALSQNAFKWTAETSLRVSLLIALIFLLQKLLGARLTAGMRYVLSLLVLAGLLLPVAPRSALSLANLFHAPAGSPPPIGDLPGSIPAPASAPPGHSVMKPQGLSFVQAASLAWVAGCFSLLAIAVWRHARWRSWIRAGEPVADPLLLTALEAAKASMQVRRPITVIAGERVASPAIFGLRRIHLLLPARVLRQLSARELRLVFLHELAHVKRNDMLLNWVLMAAQFLHWFNPLVWLALRRLRTDRELVCDAMALRKVPANERLGYGQVLVKLLEGFSNGDRMCASAVSALGGHSEVKQRILMIKHHRPASTAGTLGMALLLAMLGATTLTRAREQKPEPTTHALEVTNVASIEIKHAGPAWMSDEFIRSNLSLSVGQPADPKVIDDDVRRLYGTGKFYSIRAATEKAPQGLVVRYVLQERRLKAIKFSGNNSFSDAELLSKISSKENEPLDERKLFRDSGVIEKAYQEAGIKGVRVKYSLEMDEPAGQGVVTFQVTENPGAAGRTPRPRSVATGRPIQQRWWPGP